MNTPDALVHLAKEATKIENQPADAAALLIDAAAMCSVEAGIEINDLAERLRRSFQTMNAAFQAIEVHGAGAATKRQ